MAEQRPDESKKPTADKDQGAMPPQGRHPDDAQRSCQHTQKELDEAREEYRRTHPKTGQ